jgi:hypothetical protein
MHLVNELLVFGEISLVLVLEKRYEFGYRKFLYFAQNHITLFRYDFLFGIVLDLILLLSLVPIPFMLFFHVYTFLLV